MSIAEITGTVNYEFLIDTDKEKTIVMEGSSRSSKTFSIFQYLVINKLLQIPGYIARCWRLNSATHNDTTIQDFKDVMLMVGEAKGIQGYWDKAGSWNGQDKVYRFVNGSVMAFNGTVDEQKIQGKKQHCSFFNEVMEISQGSYRQAAMRTTEKIIMDFNPSYNRHWVFDSMEERIRKGEVFYKHSTYKDNPFLSKEQVSEIESYDPTNPENVENGTADAWTWDVYGLGKRGKVKGAIFTLWENWYGAFPDRDLCQRWGYGLDFGFSLDPTALIECALFQDILYVREIVYKDNLLVTKNMTRPDEPSLENLLEQNRIDKDAKIYADCAAPGSITDLRMSGYNVIACEKGPDSILQGINLLKRRKIRIVGRNIHHEFEHYKWKEKPMGLQDGSNKYDRKPVDKFNHAIDAIRYWARAELQRAQVETVHATHRGGRKVKVRSGLRSRRR